MATKRVICGHDVEDVYDRLKEGQRLGVVEQGDFQEVSDFREAAALAGIDLRQQNLTRASFQNADLRDANFSGALLKKADFGGANLIGARLAGADLRGANLENASIDNACLVKADLRGACFKNATLTYSSLRTTKVEGADFSGADLRGANFTGAIGCLKAIFDGADLRGSALDFTGLDKLELVGKGVKIDNFMRGAKVWVFKNVKISWLEFLPEWLKHPVRWLRQRAQS